MVKYILVFKKHWYCVFNLKVFSLRINKLKGRRNIFGNQKCKRKLILSLTNKLASEGKNRPCNFKVTYSSSPIFFSFYSKISITRTSIFITRFSVGTPWRIIVILKHYFILLEIIICIHAFAGFFSQQVLSRRILRVFIVIKISIYTVIFYFKHVIMVLIWKYSDTANFNHQSDRYTWVE